MKIACPEGEISNLLSGYNCWCVDHPLSCISLSKRSFPLCVCTRHLVLDLSMYTNNYKSAYLNSCRGWLLAIICESVRQPKSLWGTLIKNLTRFTASLCPSFSWPQKGKYNFCLWIARMDDMVFKGCTMDECVAKLKAYETSIQARLVQSKWPSWSTAFGIP